MRFSITERIGSGAFADIFAPEASNRAFKLFKRVENPAFAREAPLMYSDECAAYRIASAHPVLSRHVPTYFGPVVVDEVRGADGEDLSGRYWLELCYSLARLISAPEERKLADLYHTPDWSRVAALEEAFDEAGISHLGEASVFYWRTNCPVFIDIGVHGTTADDTDRAGAP